MRRGDRRDALGLDRVQPLERRPGAGVGARRARGDVHRAALAARAPARRPALLDLVVQNKTPDVTLTVLADGHPVGELGAGEQVTIRLGPKRTRLATLPEATFFTRYRDTFAS